MLLQWRGSDGWDVVTMEMKDWKAKGEFGFRGAGMVDVRSNAGANVGRSPTPKSRERGGGAPWSRYSRRRATSSRRPSSSDPVAVEAVVGALLVRDPPQSPSAEANRSSDNRHTGHPTRRESHGISLGLRCSDTQNSCDSYYYCAIDRGYRFSGSESHCSGRSVY